MSRFVQVLCLALIAVCIPAVASFAQYSDIRGAFLASNPSDGWEYGFINEEGEFVAYNTTFDDGQGVAGWCLDNTPGPVGAITINYTDQAIDRYGAHWEPGQICILTPVGGLSVVIRWHSPASETVRVDASVRSQSSDAGLEVAIASDGTELASDRVDALVTRSDTDDTGAASLANTQSEGSDEVTCTATTMVTSRDTIDLVITSDPERAAGHITAFISIDRVGPAGAFTDKARLGKVAPAKQAMLFGTDWWPHISEFDSLVGRG